MFATAELKRCLDRKRELLTASEAYRQSLQGEAEKLAPMIGWLELGVSLARGMVKSWNAISPLLTNWQGSSSTSSGPLGLLQKALAAVRCFQGLRTAWFQPGQRPP